jgi:DNA-binding CsgD family transcriptional regulator
LTIGAVVRWVGLVVGGLIGLLSPPNASLALVFLIVAVGGYNTWVMLAGRAASEASVPRIARLVTIFDQVGCLAFLTIFSRLAGGSQIALYVPIVVEAVAFERLDGAVASVVFFVLGLTLIQGFGTLIGHQPFSWTLVLVWSLIMLVIGSALAALDLVSLGLVAPGDLPATTTTTASAEFPVIGPSVRLSKREHEVLRLIAAGYSNPMMARELNLSETTVKTHVENLLSRLSVRNRAEAVAAASRMGLL